MSSGLPTGFPGCQGQEQAKALLDNRQARYTQQLVARLAGRNGPKEIFGRTESASGRRLMRMAHTVAEVLPRPGDNRREKGGHRDSEGLGGQEGHGLDRWVQSRRQSRGC